MPTTEANKRVMDRFLEFINSASVTLAEELIAPDAVFHLPGRPEPMRRPGGYLEIIGMMRGGFPDINGRWTRLSPRETRWLHASRCAARTVVPSSAFRQRANR